MCLKKKCIPPKKKNLVEFYSNDYLSSEGGSWSRSVLPQSTGLILLTVQ